MPLLHPHVGNFFKGHMGAPESSSHGYDNSTMTKASKKKSKGKNKKGTKGKSKYDDDVGAKKKSKKKQSKKKRSSMDDALLKKSKKKGHAPPPPDSLFDSRAKKKSQNVANVRNQYMTGSDIRAHARKAVAMKSQLLKNITSKAPTWYGGGDSTRIFDMAHTKEMLRAKELFSKPPDDDSDFQAAIKAFKKKKYNRENFSLKPMGGLGPDMKCDRFRAEQSKLLQRQLAGEKFTLFNKPKVLQKEEVDVEALQKKEQQEAAAIKIQALARGKAVRDQLLRAEQETAAIMIQKSFRGHLGRKKAADVKKTKQEEKKPKAGFFKKIFTKKVNN